MLISVLLVTKKKLISCNPRLSLNPNLTCVVSLYAKIFLIRLHTYVLPGIVALERCQGRFDIFYMFACKSPGYLYFPNQEKEKLRMYRPK